jgi:hypothetical protein
MSDDYCWIVDLDATDEDSAQLGERVLAWLVENGVVSSGRTDCVLTGGPGFPPGPRLAEWVDDPGLVVQILRLNLNGMAMLTGRNVYFSYTEPDDGFRAVCPQGHVQEPPDDWQYTVGEWQEGGDPGLHCDGCDAAYPIDRWLIEPDVALGRLGFVFWNWVELSDRLTDSVASLLAPHRVAVGCGTI